ncbi:unnamed protein product [Diabrotica balteata]|uniref:CHK kinase-like domain-containing protein n=1 Tax=Diabrotica balteata TaxID=107213 RepID=A0A9N9X4L9_DIABA|nr:unnamed protein product [Diabrotica balteata]
MSMQIKDLSGVLSSLLGSNRTIKESKISNLLARGENYGSLMLKLDVTIENEEGKEDVWHLVGKTLPETELFRGIFYVHTTYTNEMAFYDTIVPTLQNFQKDLGISNIIDCFPKCYASRKNLLKNSDVIDDDAIIILENLQATGYVNIDRTIGFDFPTTLLILSDLARLHGVSLALKLKYPTRFEEKIKCYCVPFKPSHQDLLPILRRVVAENEEIAHLAPKILPWGTHPRSPNNEPFVSLIHADTWTNNTLQKFENGEAISNKFVDFQIFQYGSPAADVFFFLFSSVPQDILEPNLDYFLKYYHTGLVEVLEDHKCSSAEFGFERFMQEMESVSFYEFPHSFLFHTLFVNARKGGHDLENLDEDQVFSDIPLKVKQKSWYMVKECSRRGWFK